MEARLYKLLLYDEGGHFKASDHPAACRCYAHPECNRCVWKLSGHQPFPNPADLCAQSYPSQTPAPAATCLQPHRDTEKEEGMWGSLVLLLPSCYQVRPSSAQLHNSAC